MSGPQFVHVETYSREVPVLRTKREAALASEGKTIQRKLTAEEICAEAARVPGSFPHVPHALEPSLVFGVSPDEVPALLEGRIKEINAALRKRRADRPAGESDKGLRAHRKDSQSLFTMVSSHPIPWESEDGRNNYESEENAALLDEWTDSNLEWAKKLFRKLGIELVSVVMHYDEPYPHLHFLGIPIATDLNPRMDARQCHPGHQAKSCLEQLDGEGDKAFKRRQNAAYIVAMRTFQDEYYDKVGRDAGLSRTGPRRRRLLRGEWLAEKAAARSRALDGLRSKALNVQIESQERQLASQAGEAAKVEKKVADLEETKSGLEGDLTCLQDSIERTAKVCRDVNDQASALENAADDLAVTKKKLEDDIAQLAAHRCVEETALANIRSATELARVELAAEKQKCKDERAKLSAEFAEKEQNLEILVEGIEAYADGRLKFQPGNTVSPFSIDRNTPDAEATRDRLLKVKPQLAKIIGRLDARISLISDVMEASVRAWASGLLRGVGKPNAKGEPTFFLDDSRAADELLERIAPYRTMVGKVVGMLPDRDLVDWLKKGLQRLTSTLNRAEKEETERFEQTMNAFVESKMISKD